jgi:hypothetical protein
MNYITIGYDCSPAAALRNMNLRKFALPFDWVQSNIQSIEACFRDDFARYHTELKFNSKKTRLIDVYGFEFPHDYPLLSTDELKGPASQDIISPSDALGEGAYEEKPIAENWLNFYNIVKEKYDRRIERFRTFMKDPAPIIVLSRYHQKEDIFRLKELFAKYYNKTNIRFINSSNKVFENDFMVNIHTEQNGEWNETSIWQSAIDTWL